MTRLALIALPLLIAACAASPTAAPVAQTAIGCTQIAIELGRAAEEQRLAQEQKETAWKAVIPFAVAARYAKSKSAAEAAEQRAEALRQQAAAQGCPTQGS